MTCLWVDYWMGKVLNFTFIDWGQWGLRWRRLLLVEECGSYKKKGKDSYCLTRILVLFWYGPRVGNWIWQYEGDFQQSSNLLLVAHSWCISQRNTSNSCLNWVVPRHPRLNSAHTITISFFAFENHFIFANYTPPNYWPKLETTGN